MGENKERKLNLFTFILLLIVIALISSFATYITMQYLENNATNDKELGKTNIITVTNIIEEINNNNNNNNNKILSFDLNFLKLENQKENKIYSPLSIKYALKMLEEATNGETKLQISKLLEDFELTTYTSNKNFSISNAFFVRDSFENKVKETYINSLKNKYDADVKFDTFKTSKNINNWIKEKTFGIIPNILSDSDVTELDFALINALAIDMEWEEKFIMDREGSSTDFLHEKRILDNNLEWNEILSKMIDVHDIDNVSSNLFKNGNKETEISGMYVYATINNYDIINELGEEYIKETVSKEYKKFAKGESYDEEHVIGDFPLSEDITENGINKDLKEFFPTYISELDSNYHKSGTSTDFSIYTDKDVKVFAKDLKKYNNTTLQYVGIMPTTENLDEFIENIESKNINNYISNLKDINYKNFKEGVVTRIYGHIPKFDFEYTLNLMEDLKSNNVTNVFDSTKADLSNMVEGDAYISKALHKANIQFTQDGIKAAAATFIGGEGAGMPFDYEFEVPVEEIDITFDKPYLFLIRDKDNGEIVFMGTVYEPLLWEDEPEKENVF